MRAMPTIAGPLGLAVMAMGSHASSPLAGQSSELVAELGATWSLPPIDVEGGAAGFFVTGLRASRWGLGGSGLHASLLVGRSMDEVDAGDVLSGEAGGEAWRDIGGGWSSGVRGRAFGLRVDAPIEQRSYGVEGAVLLRWRAPAFRASVRATGGAGQSRLSVEIPPSDRDGPTRTRERTDDLWRYGTEVELLWGDGPVLAGVRGGIDEGADGTYSRGGVQLLATAWLGVVEVHLDQWDTPAGAETTGGLAFHVPAGGWSARGVAGRPDPDPLLRDERGRGVGGVLVGRRILGGGADPATRSGRAHLHTVLDETPEGARVRIELPVETGAATVTVLGDFTLWEEVRMERRGDRWSVELDIPAGTHHYGFMVDDEWYVPEDAPDAVPDEWGRRSLILVAGAGGEVR